MVLRHQPQGGLGTAARAAGDGMLVSARGNSGVILSQLFDGIAAGLSGLETADAGQLSRAFEEGVAHAYRVVLEPTEGTILTVAREATQAACAAEAADIAGFFAAFLAQAERSLQHTPELLPVLKKAGVVDSGGAGLLRIVEGMQRVLTGEPLPAASVPADAPGWLTARACSPAYSRIFRPLQRTACWSMGIAPSCCCACKQPKRMWRLLRWKR